MRKTWTSDSPCAVNETVDITNQTRWSRLLDIRRAGVAERTIYGCIAVCDGHDTFLTHDTDALVFGRSLTKPFQQRAIADVLDPVLSWEEKAIALSSHNGSAIHRRLASGILDPVLWPHMKLPESNALESTESGKSKWHHPCSGKHAAILRACLLAGWPVESYLEIDHPYQVAYRKELEKSLSVDLKNRAFAQDGCGLPTYAMTVSELARLYASLAVSKDENWIWEAAHKHPELVGGRGRVDSLILQSAPNAFAKEGADGLLAISVHDENQPGGFGLVIKLAHGHDLAILWQIASYLLRHLQSSPTSKATFAERPTIPAPPVLVQQDISFAPAVTALTVPRQPQTS